MTRVRTTCPPSFLFQTPGTALGMIQFFHRYNHCFLSFMCVSFVERRTQAVRRDCISRWLPSQVSVESLERPHPRARPAPSSDRAPPALAMRLADGARVLVAAVVGRHGRGDERRVGFAVHRTSLVAARRSSTVNE